MSFPFFQQYDTSDCGPTCLRMIAKHYGKNYSLEELRKRAFISRNGVSLLGISDAAESIGFKTLGVKISLEQLNKDMPLPCILHWNQNHFVVCYDIKHGRKGNKYHIADPAGGLIVFDENAFSNFWLSSVREGVPVGIGMALQPTPSFYSFDDERGSRRDVGFFLRYISPYRREIFQLFLGMCVTSILQLIFPFLTQSLVDVGIQGRDLSFIILILAAQVVISSSQLAVDFIRSWISLHVASRINISLISDFLIKLMKMPLRFFDSKMVGDIMQRIGDHGRIQSFLLNSSINTIFSTVNFFIFAFVLAYYNITILTIFIIGNTLYIIWVTLFLKYRRILDVKRFSEASHEQSTIIQLIQGMQDIKLNNCEKQKRWQWERIQVKLFRISVKAQTIGQIQQVGSIFFSQMTNIIISYIAARSIVEGHMTLGMMVSLTYIVGALNGPIQSVIGFISQYQDAKISIERLNEIHGKADEDNFSEAQISKIDKGQDIKIDNVSFSYDGTDRNYILRNVNLTIPGNKTTAIVGASGSGKTTLLKLILGFYEVQEGQVSLGQNPFKNINPHVWRENMGAVLQDGYIFSDTIANNIAVNCDEIDEIKLIKATQMARIYDFIVSLPLGFNTKIGMDGMGLSHGQRQRLLIARVVYKNPDYIIFDEATNSLDANNEKQILENLYSFYNNKTVIVVAHRLSTIVKSDLIIVLEDGKVAEQGTHDELLSQKGRYYNLVHNQLNIGQ